MLSKFYFYVLKWISIILNFVCVCIGMFMQAEIPLEAKATDSPLELELQTVVCWETNSGALQEQCMILISKPSLQALKFSMFGFWIFPFVSELNYSRL